MTLIKLIKPVIHRDSRGMFFESWRYGAHLPAFVQDNVSISKKGVVRGMHYQREAMAQGKLIRVLKGVIMDYALNLKTGELTKTLLDDHDMKALYVPPGYAHGFQALSDDTILHYKCTEFYSPDHEAGFNPADFDWPIPVTEISDKDRALPRFK